MSGSQGHAFAMAAQAMTERIRKLGPNPLKTQSKIGKPRKPGSDEDIEEETGYRGRKPPKDKK